MVYLYELHGSKYQKDCCLSCTAARHALGGTTAGRVPWSLALLRMLQFEKTNARQIQSQPLCIKIFSRLPKLKIPYKVYSKLVHRTNASRFCSLQACSSYSDTIQPRESRDSVAGGLILSLFRRHDVHWARYVKRWHKEIPAYHTIKLPAFRVWS